MRRKTRRVRPNTFNSKLKHTEADSTQQFQVHGLLEVCCYFTVICHCLWTSTWASPTKPKRVPIPTTQFRPGIRVWSLYTAQATCSRFFYNSPPRSSANFPSLFRNVPSKPGSSSPFYPLLKCVASLQHNHSQLFMAFYKCFYDFCIMFVYFVFPCGNFENLEGRDQICQVFLPAPANPTTLDRAPCTLGIHQPSPFGMVGHQ